MYFPRGGVNTTLSHHAQGRTSVDIVTSSASKEPRNSGSPAFLFKSHAPRARFHEFTLKLRNYVSLWAENITLGELEIRFRISRRVAAQSHPQDSRELNLSAILQEWTAERPQKRSRNKEKKKKKKKRGNEIYSSAVLSCRIQLKKNVLLLFKGQLHQRISINYFVNF